MRAEKGVTLTALVIYMAIFSIILATMATISNYFYKNIRTVNNSPRYVSEFNKFAMFFVQDVKNNTDVTDITNTSVTFADGTVYILQGSKIYRNDLEIAKHIKNLVFSKSNYTVNSTNKVIINVNMTVGNSSEETVQNIDFVLKYW